MHPSNGQAPTPSVPVDSSGSSRSAVRAQLRTAELLASCPRVIHSLPPTEADEQFVLAWWRLGKRDHNNGRQFETRARYWEGLSDLGLLCVAAYHQGRAGLPLVELLRQVAVACQQKT